MIFLTVVKYTEPQEKEWHEIHMTCGKKVEVMAGKIMYGEHEAKAKAARLAAFAPDHFHFDPTAQVERL